ncbi:uncharacterized protein [Panulirus ornatus]|uniref:uncharacterized protein isoform X1 n=1 Tax=Panulirus ornatus TaxID=150431 RepID=UPI003A86EB0E
MVGRRRDCQLQLVVVGVLGLLLQPSTVLGADRSKRQDTRFGLPQLQFGNVGFNFGFPANFGGGGNPNNGSNRQDNNNPLGNLGNLIGGFLNQGRPPNQNNNNQNNNQGGQPGGNVLGNINIGGVPIQVTGDGTGNFGISFGGNSCRRNNGGCEQGCRQTRRGSRCTCNPGYLLNPDRRTCSDIDECRQGNGGCSDVCTNSPGSYTCSCRNGALNFDQRSCSSGSSGSIIQSCRFNNGGCSQICSQNRQGVTCLCRPGFSLGRDGTTCLQVDQCLSNNGGCQDVCNSSPRGPVCSCQPGKVLQRDGRTCQDLDECRFNNGGCHHFCINTQGSYQCQCQNGYQLLDQRRCQFTGRPQTTTTTTTSTTTTTTTSTTTRKPPTTGGGGGGGGGGEQPSSGCGINPKKSLFNRIVGGKPADPKDWPWMAALLLKSGSKQYCGGTLITDRHILTAAHCLKPFKAEEILIRLGEYNFDVATDNSHSDFNVVDLRMHEGYNSDTQENDIAILKMDKPATFSEFIWPVCLPPADTSYVGRDGYVTGWGTIYYGGPVSTVLQEVTVPVWSREDCSAAYPNKVFPGMMCAGSRTGGKDSCQGDSGGPYQVQDFRSRRWFVAGVVSWGIQCARPENPGVYTEVSLYIDWIKNNSVF